VDLVADALLSCLFNCRRRGAPQNLKIEDREDMSDLIITPGMK
jgi:hypothetical protein